MRPLLAIQPPSALRESSIAEPREPRRTSDVQSPCQRGLSASARLAILEAANEQALRTAVAAAVREDQLATALIWFSAAGSSATGPARLDGLLTPGEGFSHRLQQQLADAALSASQSGVVEIRQLTAAIPFNAAAFPIPHRDGEALVAVVGSAELQTPGPGSTHSVIARLELIATLAGLWFLQRQADAATRCARAAAELVELTTLVRGASDLTQGCQRLADSLQSHLHAGEVFVFLCRQGRKDGRLEAASGGRVMNRLDSESQQLEAALQESVLRSCIGVWPPHGSDQRHALLAHQQFAEQQSIPQLLSAPLQTKNGDCVGSVLLTFPATSESISDPNPDLMRAERFLRAASQPLATVLNSLRRETAHRWLRKLKTIQTSLTASRAQAAGWIASAVALLLMIPVTYTVKAGAELQPAARRFVAAPFDGPLEKCLVEPGDLVQTGQLLATMDGREVRWELAEIEASLNKAVRERNTLTSSRDFGAAAVTAQEVARLEQRLELLQHRAESLEIRSPVTGCIVSGDHREAEGVPLETGQTLFEIAPLDRIVIEASIPEDDVSHVTAGMHVTVQPDAMPELSLNAVIRKVHPKAELRDGANVFIAEADISNPDGILRPGMRGRSRIATTRHPLGWNLFHKPMAWVLGWIGW